MNDFLKNVMKEIGNEYASLAADGIEAGDVDSYIDTGSYIFNAHESKYKELISFLRLSELLIILF